MGRKTKNTSAIIPYNGEAFDVSGEEFLAWETLLGDVACDSAKGQWLTYDYLFNLGHLIQEPKVPKPTEKQARVEQAKREKEDKESWEGIPKFVNGELWTPTRLLNEREKLLRAKEKQIEKDQKRLARIIENQRKAAVVEHFQRNQFALDAAQFYRKDGRPYTQRNYISTIIVLTLVLFVVGFITVVLLVSHLH